MLESVRRRLALAAAILLALIAGIGLAFWRKYGGDPWADGVVAPANAFVLHGPVDSEGPGFALALWQTVGMTMDAGHTLRPIHNGAIFDALVDEIHTAKTSVNIDMYIWEKGEASRRVSEALIERARAGVACRIVVDDLGSAHFRDNVGGPLEAAGCQVRIFRPLPDGAKFGRNHRKLVIVDGRTAFTGGFGIRDNWLGDGIHDEKWRDASVRFTGPAVSQAQQSFAQNWQDAGGTVLPPDDFPAAPSTGGSRAAIVGSSASPYVTKAERLTQLMIAAAKRRLWISNAYFVPSQAIRAMLADKASQGVDVRVLTAGKKSDSKTSFGLQQGVYGTLGQKGVKFYEYKPSMLHAKTMLVDDSLALIGSINLDPLSLNTLDDVALVVDDRAVNTELTERFEADCKQASAVKP